VLSLRAPATSPLLRAVARLLIAALVFSLVPPPSTEASIRAPASPAALPSRALPDLAAAAASAAEEVLVCVVVVVADPFSLTKSAFGELLAHTGNDPQPYAFAGEPYDPNVGFQYHRARHYDSRIGRFLGMDPFAGIVFDPPTLHRYLYVRGDPANRADPTGEYEGGLSGALTTVAAQITLIGSRAVAGTITRLGAIRAIRALNWTFGILSAAYARFGNIFVQLEQGLERGTGRVDIVLRTAPQVVRRAVIEGKAWSLDAIAQAPGRAASMLDQLRIQAGNYAVEFGDDLVYAFPELPKTPAGQALLQEVQAILTSAGVQRVTFGVSQLMDEVATLLK
jgi:RHS repeat-associated protein